MGSKAEAEAVNSAGGAANGSSKFAIVTNVIVNVVLSN